MRSKSITYIGSHSVARGPRLGMLLLHFTLPPIRGGLLYCSSSSKPIAGRGRFLKPGQASQTRLSQHTGSLQKTNTQQQNMGAEASAEAGAEVFAEAIGDMCFGLPPGTGMLLRAPIALGAAAAKAAAAPKPIHVHVGGGAAVTAAAAAGAASRYGASQRPGHFR